MIINRSTPFKVLIIFIFIGLTGCQTNSQEVTEVKPPIKTIQSEVEVEETDLSKTVETEEPEDMIQEEAKLLANVISVDVAGKPGQYSFSVGISSPDTGCDQYADWWEVISQEGELIYRRILLHSHVTEQPFVRSGGPVQIEMDTEVTIRAHMNPGGYGGKVFIGSVESGCIGAGLGEDFAQDLENQGPLPSGCNF